MVFLKDEYNDNAVMFMKDIASEPNTTMKRKLMNPIKASFGTLALLVPFMTFGLVSCEREVEEEEEVEEIEIIEDDELEENE